MTGLRCDLQIVYSVVEIAVYNILIKRRKEIFDTGKNERIRFIFILILRHFFFVFLLIDGTSSFHPNPKIPFPPPNYSSMKWPEQSHFAIYKMEKEY